MELNESERHAIGHAQYQVDQASGDKPECCFDYELVVTLLGLIGRLRWYCEAKDEANKVYAERNAQLAARLAK